MTNGYACVMDIVFPGDTNHHGTLFGGLGLALMDKAAFIAAARHARLDFVTASCERTVFVAPARLGDIVEVTGRVVRVGRRSLGVDTELVAEVPASGERRLCGRGRFNMVAIGEGELTLPPLGEEGEAARSLGMTDLIFPDRTSHYGSLYGGHALAAMAKAAFISASRASRKRVVMASCRRADLESHIASGELLDVVPEVIETGSTSLTIAVDLWAEKPFSTERRFCGCGEYVMVAVDDDHRPTPLGAV